MDIGVIGGGSLGLLVSSYLSSEHDVTLYVKRHSQKKSINNSGITLKQHNKDEQNTKVNCVLMEDLTTHDLIFIAVKQPQIDEVIYELQKKAVISNFIFLQNGMGHIEKIMTLPGNLYVGVVDHGATRINDNQVNHLGVGTISLALLKGEKNNLLQMKKMLDREQFPFQVTGDWEALLKSKLIINAVINPITALFDVPNGAIISNIHLQTLAKQLSAETAAILDINKDKAWASVQRVARNTAHNTSSMRADIIHNRETEIDAISGYVLQNADNIEAPYTSFIYEAVLALQAKERK